jgi:hypothetical protein
METIGASDVPDAGRDLSAEGVAAVTLRGIGAPQEAIGSSIGTSEYHHGSARLRSGTLQETAVAEFWLTSERAVTFARAKHPGGPIPRWWSGPNHHFDHFSF